MEHGLGKYKTCPVCSLRGIQFIEAHLTFECNRLDQSRTKWSSLIKSFDTAEVDPVLKMKDFLGQDEATPEVLEIRGLYLDKLVTAWEEILGKDSSKEDKQG